MLEDAAYHGLSYGVQEPPSLWSLDTDGGDGDPGPHLQQDLQSGGQDRLRGLTRGLIDPILRLKGNHDFGSANFNQQLLEQALASGDYDRHVARLRELYGRKRDVFLGALEQHLGPLGAEIRLDPSQRGLVRLDDGSGGARHRFRRAVLPAVPAGGSALRAGRIRVCPRAGTRAQKPPPPDLRRARGGGAVEGARRLAAALRGCLEPARLRPAGSAGSREPDRGDLIERRAVDLGQGRKQGRPSL